MTRVEKVLQELQLDYIKFAVKESERMGKLPLVKEKQVKGLIWNLLKSDKYIKQISYKDYSEIMDILVNRLK